MHLPLPFVGPDVHAPLPAVIDDTASNTLYMVQEYCDGGPVMTEQEYNTPLASEVARGE